MRFINLDIMGTIEDSRVALFRGTIVIREFPTANEAEMKIILAAGRLCPGVYVEGKEILASVNVNGYDQLMLRNRALVNTLKDYIAQVRNHKATHEALGV